MFKGSFVALVTPFKKGRIDEIRLKSLVDFHLENGTDGIVACGTTGESATLTHEEHRKVMEFVIKSAKGRIPVMVGAGSNSTEETLALVAHAQKCGAAGVLLVVPYYNKPTPAGLYAHFKTVAKSTKLPIMLYNIPSRTGINLPAETVIQLVHDCPNIIGIKEASGSIDYAAHLMNVLPSDRFTVMAGDDSLTIPLMALGAKGVISVIANILPQAMSEMCRAWTRGEAKRALELHRQMFPLMRALFLETNPIAIKSALSQLKMCGEELRLPLVPLAEENRKKLATALTACPLVIVK